MPHAFSKDGLRIHFETGGTGKPVLLLHPNHATCGSWIELGWFDALTSVGFRAVALDARGFGQSDDVAAARHLAPGTSTEDIGAVLDLLGVTAAHVCGFSLGAAAALRFAVDMPERVTSLVLGGLGAGPLVQMGLFLGASADEARRQALTQLDRMRPSSDRTQHYFSVVRAAIGSAPLAAVGAGHLRVPVLGISGETDPQMPALLYEQLRDLGASIQIRQISGVGHGTCFTDTRFRQAAIEYFAASTPG